MFLSLENGLISSADNLSWAGTFYGLAQLNDNFFNAHFSPAIYEKYKDAFNWGPQALPVFEWDGVVFVACVDPYSVPSQVASQLDFICRPILATYEGLIRGWHHVVNGQPSKSTAEAAAPPSTSQAEAVAVGTMNSPTDMTPPELNPALESKPPFNARITSESGENPKPKVGTNEIEAQFQAPSPNLTNLMADFSKGDASSLPNSVVQAEPAPDLNPPLDLEPQLNSPAAVESWKMDEEPPPMGLSLEESNNEAPAVGHFFELEDSQPRVEVPSAEVSKSIGSESGFEMPEGLEFAFSPQREPIPPISNSSSSQSTEASQPNSHSGQPREAMPEQDPLLTAVTQPQKPAPKAESVPTVPPPRPIEGSVAASGRKTPSVPPPSMELEEELKLCFAKAYQSYRNLMILKLNGDAVIPFRWDPSYKNPKSLNFIPLDRPSIFRIAAKTLKPFHGPVFPNDINIEFFANWFGGHTPSYLTIVPLFFERECVGFLLAAADETLDRKDSLHLMETTANKVEANFGVRLAS
jgi:hypothetical protein